MFLSDFDIPGIGTEPGFSAVLGTVITVDEPILRAHLIPAHSNIEAFEWDGK
jgi:hypothetical protein